jgi:FAD/FMN-containing dehydrogenase
MNRDAAAPAPATIAKLREVLGPGGWLDSPADREPFETDFRRLHHGSTPLVALPDSTARVAALVAFCARERIALVPQGGNTSYCGGATPRPAGAEIVVSLRRMNRIRHLDTASDSMTAEAGCVLADGLAAGGLADAVDRKSVV